MRIIQQRSNDFKYSPCDGEAGKRMRARVKEGFATNDPRRVIGVLVARVGIDFIPRRQQRRRELESSSAKSRFRYNCVCTARITRVRDREKLYVHVLDPETPPSLFINDPQASSTMTMTMTHFLFFFHAVVFLRVDKFPFLVQTRERFICSLLGPLRHWGDPSRTHKEGRITHKDPHSKKELTRLMQSSGQSLFIQG